MAEITPQINIISLNCRGFSGKRDLVTRTILPYSPDVIFLQETFLDFPLEIPGYRSSHLLARCGERGGLSRGLSTYFLSNIQCGATNTQRAEHYELQKITIFTTNTRVNLINLYAASTLNPNVYPIPTLYEELRRPETVIIAGDLNIHAPHLRDPTTRLEREVGFCLTLVNAFILHTANPTRANHTLDFFVLSAHIGDIPILLPDVASDHLPVMATFSIQPTTAGTRPTFRIPRYKTSRPL